MARPLVNQPTPFPTRKVQAMTMAAAAGTFLADLASQAWPAFPASGEPFFVALFVFAVGYVVRDRA